MHVIWFTAMSIDGRIAGPGDDLAFLDTVSHDGESPTEFDEFMATIDAMVVGGATLRWLHREGHELPYRGVPVWLVSRDQATRERAEQAADDVTPVQCVEGDMAAVLAAIDAAGHERVWICGGGDIAGQALAADLVDELILTMAPTVLGAGPAVFDHATLPRRAFALEECRAYGGTSVRMRWTRRR